MKILCGFLLAALVFSFSSESFAIQIAASAGALQIPNSSYHLLTIDLQTSFGVSENSAILLQVGSTPPFIAHAFSEIVPYISINWEWFTARSGFVLFGAVGIGTYSDVIDGKLNLLPSLVLNGGARIGSENLGVQFTMSTYMGIGPLWQFIGYSVAWPMYNFLGGIYVAF